MRPPIPKNIDHDNAKNDSRSLHGQFLPLANGQVLLRHDLGGALRVLSAGIRPQPKVADGAIAALQQAGLPTEGLYPKDIDAVMNGPIDLVVTVCDNAEESCSAFPRAVPKIHISFHDPHGEPLERFIEVRDDIRARLVPAVRQTLNL